MSKSRKAYYDRLIIYDDAKTAVDFPPPDLWPRMNVRIVSPCSFASRRNLRQSLIIEIEIF